MEKVYDEVDAAPIVRKVTIVGVGQVGMACAYSIMQQVKCSSTGLLLFNFVYSIGICGKLLLNK